ncbi:MAG: hypothetical protein MJB57_18050 [Gemmatimonadetes bacterium]|nr:hypothetical protein [Gemmatimonadota bacterium]
MARDSATRDSAAREATDTLEVARDTTEVDFPRRDPFLERLARLPGFRTIEYRGRDVELDVAEETVLLREDAQSKYGESVLDADTIKYWAGIQFIQAQGNIALQGEGQDVTSDSIINYDVSQAKGTIMDAQTSFAERGAEWFIRGDATPRGAGTVFVESGRFTSCELEHPHYYFRAGQIKVVANDIIVAWPVTLYISDVPIIWLPFFAHDLRQGRRSGFLPPRFGVNDVVSTSSSFQRSVTDFGYYFAINEFMDAQATMDWFSGRFTRVNGAFRYKSLKKFFEGNLLANYSFGDSRTLQVQMRHQHDITPVTNLRVDANFISNTQVFEEQSFDPFLQTQRVSSNVGLQHRFSFASVNLSASRRQDLGTLRGKTDLTLPNLQMTFTPITLFRAPRNRAGVFNNIVLNGGFSFSRLQQTQEEADDRTTDRGAVNTGIRIGSFGVSSNANFNRVETVPVDTLGMELPASAQTRVDYGASADYQVDLVGSTTFRPTVSIASSTFRSDSTGNRFIAAPTRLRVGASLSTDLYGFFPGFGSFERIRHKISPRFTYDYSPAVETADSLLQIPGFPVTNLRAENRVTVTLNQTFEAKLRDDIELDEEAQALLEGRELDADSIAFVRDSLAAIGETPIEPDALTAPPDSLGADSLGVADPGAPRQAREQRNIVLLGINSSQLEFDFSRENEPVLTTDRWNHRINSDLLRGLSLNLALDLFDGVGEERTFAPILSQLTGSFTFSSASGLGGLLGLGGGRSSVDPRDRLRNAADSRYRLQSFEENRDPLDPGLRSGGPWTLSLSYSLQRGREVEGVEALNRQTIQGTLALNPTPNWRLAWRTSYNVTDGEFADHVVTLDRDLHRWMATFMFARSPNGNFIFQMSVNLRDAPDLKFDYDQQTVDR